MLCRDELLCRRLQPEEGGYSAAKLSFELVETKGTGGVCMIDEDPL